jgi:hypothetical protein
VPNAIEDKAISVATDYLRKQGYTVLDVSKGKGPNSEHRGYDLVARKAGENLKIEVKGCTRRWGIPDPYVTEFDSEHRLVADFLYVVYFIDSETELCVIPREAFKPEHIVPKYGYRIRSGFKNKKSLEPYLRQL